MVAHAYNPSTWEAEARESEIQCYPQLHSKFKTSLTYMGPCLKQTYKEET